MSESNHNADTRPVHQHEVRDADLRKLTYLAFGILALIIFGFIVTEIVFYFFVGRQQVRPSPQALFVAGTQMPPPPRLQEHSGVDLQDYLRQQDRVLETYGWVNRKASVVRIPIDQAMTLLLQQGLPVRKPGQITYAAPIAPHEVPRGDFAPPPTPVPGPRKQ